MSHITRLVRVPARFGSKSSLLRTSTTLSHCTCSSAPPLNHITRSFGTVNLDDKPLFSSLREKIQDKLEDRKENQMEQQFQEYIQEMWKCKKYTIQHWYEFLKKNADKASGWRGKLAGYMGQQGAEEMKKAVKLWEGFTQQERENIHLIDSLVKIRAAQTAGVLVQDINLALRHFDSQAMTHSWLQARKKKKLPAPTSQEEMEQLMRENPPPPSETMKRIQMRVARR